MTEAELYDGTVLEFPDGTSPEVIQRVVKEQTMQRRQGGAAPAAAPAASSGEPGGLSKVLSDVEGVFGVGGGSPPAPPEPADDESWLSSILSGVGGVLDQGARGIATGATNVLGLPGVVGKGINSLARYGAEKAGLPEPLVSAAGHINIVGDLWPTGEDMQRAGDAVNEKIAGSLGVEPPRTEPENLPERLASRIGEEVGGMALPAAGVVGAATKVGAKAAREGGRMSRMFLEPAAVDPARYVGKELTLATGAGTGAGIANEAVDRDTTAGQVADLIGALTGAGATGLGSSMLKGGGDILRAIFSRPGYVDDVVRETVVDRLAEAGGLQTAVGQAPDTAPLVEAIEQGPRIGKVVPGVQETLADRTRNPGIASLEYSRQTGPNSGMFNTRRQNNAAAIDDTISGMAPEGSPAQLRSELELERSRRLSDADVQATNAAEDARRAVEPLAPVGTSAARGNTIRSALEEARDKARQRTADAYENANVTGNRVAAEDLVDTIENSIIGLTEAERNLLPESLIDRIRKLGSGADEGPVNTGLLDASGNPITRAPEPAEPIRLKEAADLRTELNRLSAAASADPRAERGGRNAARVLSKLADDVDGFIMKNLSPDEREALTAARGTKFDEAERFTRQGDPVASALARNEGGLPRMRDENVAKTFTNTQNMDRLLAQADTPEVRSAIRNELLSGADTSRAERINDFIATNSEQIDRFPGLRDELTRAAGARTAEAEATARRSGMERELGTADRRGTGTVGKYLNYGDAQSQKAIREVVSAPDPAKAADELLDFVGDSPRAVQGARRAFWDYMEGQTRRAGETTASVDGRQPWMPRNLKAFLDDPKNRAVADRFYRDNPEHVENLRIIADALQGLDTRNAGRVPNTSGTAQGILPSAETVGSRLFAYQRGQVGGTWLITSLAAIAGRRAVRGARSAGIERMLDEALLDPDAAALLLRDNNPANRAALARKAKLWFGNDAANIMNALSGDEKDDDTMEAIGGR